MECKKYEIIEDGGRKRIRSLRDFTVQDRHVCVGDLGGYVYDANTLSQEGNCWIFSGSLEYPCVHVLDEAIVDMGSNLPKAISRPRPKATIISGNSRIMGAISFETQAFSVAQAPAMFEQGAYNAPAGKVPTKEAASTRVRIPAQVFAGTAGKVAITSTAYEARLISLDEAGIVTDATDWTVGGPAVTLTSTASYLLVELRKVGETAITPADVTAAGVTVTRAREATVRIFNSSIVPVYNGSVTAAANILRYEVTDPSEKPYQVDIQNSYLRIKGTFNRGNAVRANADFINVNYNLVLTPDTAHYIIGTYRNTNINTPASANVAEYNKNRFDVSDCPNFEYSTVTFPDLTAMYASNKTFHFRGCNMPAGSAIHYYDPKVNVWDNIDFTKAMADLGKTAFANTTIVSSNVQGMYRVRGNTSGVMGGLLEAASSFDGATYSGVPGATYDSIIYKDCVIKGIFSISGRNVFGGTLGGASKITNTSETAMVIDGSFRIEGNAQVTDTQLKGNGYIGGNAELKNGAVEGYVYMADNAKYIPGAAANPHKLVRIIMRNNAQVLKQRDAPGITANMELYDNAILDAIIVNAGTFIMRGNSLVRRSDTGFAFSNYGNFEMKESAKIDGLVSLYVRGEVTLVGNFSLTSGNPAVCGKRVISDVSQTDKTELPPTKITW